MNLKRNAFALAGWILPAVLVLSAVVPHALGASLTVTNLADSGPGTLRDRIALAAPGDSISFGVFGTVRLNSELVITQNLTVAAFGSAPVYISGSRNSRVFNVTGGTINLSSLAIVDGRVVGTNGATGHNGQDVYGGGVLIANGASVTLVWCLVSNNVVVEVSPVLGHSGGMGSEAASPASAQCRSNPAW